MQPNTLLNFSNPDFAKLMIAALTAGTDFYAKCRVGCCAVGMSGVTVISQFRSPVFPYDIMDYFSDVIRADLNS